MNISKTVQILATFSQKELDSFAEFATSPFFNRNKKVLPLLTYFQKIFPNPKEEALNKVVVFKNAYPEKSFDAAYLRKQSSFLYQLLRKFLIQLEQSIPVFEQEFALLKQLEKRNLTAIFQLQNQALNNLIEKQATDQGSHFFYQRYQLANEADAFFGRQQKRRFDRALQLKIDSFDVYYLIEKLKGSCEMLNRKKIVEGGYQLNFIDAIVDFLDSKNDISQIPIIKIYLQILKTLRDEAEESHFEKLANLLNIHQLDFSKKEAVAMYRYAQNYCIRRINQGNTAYFRKLFELFQTQLIHQINLPNGMLSPDDYKNIVTVGLRLKEFKWVKIFIFDYKKTLQINLRDNVFNYNLATYYYGIQDYDSAIQLLNTVRFTDIFYEISGKIILAKTYFIKEEVEALFYLIDAFKLNLKRNKEVAANYKMSITNFLIQLKKVTKLKAEEGYMTRNKFREKLVKLEVRLNVVEPIVDRNWLLKQLLK